MMGSGERKRLASNDRPTSRAARSSWPALLALVALTVGSSWLWPATAHAQPSSCTTNTDAFTCDDDDPCTVDTCDPTVGCVHTGSCIDAFLCYDVKSREFHGVDDIRLVDRFNDLRYDVTETRELCAPAADKCGCEGECPTAVIGDPATHLRRYKIERADKHASVSLPRNFTVATCLGTVSIDTDDDDRIMVPAAKGLSDPPPAPDAESHGVDHFHCYEAALRKNSKLPRDLQVTLKDQFTGQPKTFDVKGIGHLCVAADKNGEGVKNPDAALLCYEIKAARKQPKFVKAKKVWTTDQFGSLRQDLVAESEACLPAVIDGGGTTTTIVSTTTSTTSTTTSTRTTTTSTSSSTSTSTSTTSTSSSTSTSTSTASTSSSTSTSSTTSTSTTSTMIELVGDVSLPSEPPTAGSNFVAVASGVVVGYYSVTARAGETSMSVVLSLPADVLVPPTILFFDPTTRTFVPVQSASAPVFSVANHTLTIVIDGASVPSITQLNG